MTADLDLILAHLECAKQGYPVHVGCMGEATWSDESEDYYCNRCEKRVPFGSVCDPPGHDYYERDVAWLIGRLERWRRAAEILGPTEIDRLFELAYRQDMTRRWLAETTRRLEELNSPGTGK